MDMMLQSLCITSEVSAYPTLTTPAVVLYGILIAVSSRLHYHAQTIAHTTLVWFLIPSQY